jgi:GT2 family glycosyltransferase
MTSEIVSVICGGPGPILPGNPRVRRIMNRKNKVSPCQAYQRALDTTTAEVLILLHDDLEIHDGWWREAFLDCFKDVLSDGDSKTVGIGLGGALGLANRDLYRKPFMVGNLARIGYASNQTDAEVHGERLDGVRQVAVLEQFAMAIRTDWLRARGGFPVAHLTHHMLDACLACEAARDGKELWMVGASCTHHGGGTSIKGTYQNAKWLLGGSTEQDHLLAHRWIWDEYRDVLPLVTM